MYYHQPLNELELICFFSRTFGEDIFSPHEMRLSREEVQYLQSQYSHIKLTPLSAMDSLGKAWFEICPEGAAL